MWCKGYMSPIYKMGDRQYAGNYRPITVSSCLGKVFNAILNDRLNKFLEEHNIICHEQIGFTK